MATCPSGIPDQHRLALDLVDAMAVPGRRRARARGTRGPGRRRSRSAAGQRVVRDQTIGHLPSRPGTQLIGQLGAATGHDQADRRRTTHWNRHRPVGPPRHPAADPRRGVESYRKRRGCGNVRPTVSATFGPIRFGVSLYQPHRPVNDRLDTCRRRTRGTRRPCPPPQATATRPDPAGCAGREWGCQPAATQMRRRLEVVGSDPEVADGPVVRLRSNSRPNDPGGHR